jgi:rhodanese-related sulfurtransferase
MGTDMTLGAAARIDSKTLQEWLASGDTALIDVREPAEYVREHIVGAQLMPLHTIDLAQLPRGKRIVLCCASGNRSQTAARKLAIPGIVDLEGGLFAWKAYGLPTVKKTRTSPGLPRRFDARAQAA